ncbi:MAG: hypothetical protein ACLVEX_18365 [Ruthenibacterium lactatiformans]
MSDDNPIWLDQTTHTTQEGAAAYTAEVSYNPGAADLANGGQPPKLSGQWKYHTYEDQRLKVWSADTVADAVKLAGATVTPNVTFGDPVYVEDREGVHIYRVTMTISNIDEMFDAGQTRFYFLVSSDAGVQRRNADHRDLRYAPVSGLHRQCQFRPRRAERRQQRRSAGQRCVPDRHRAGQTVFRLELSEPDAPLRAQHVPEHDPDVR